MNTLRNIGKFLAVMILAAFPLAAQQTVYIPPAVHGPFTNTSSQPTGLGQLLGPYFELPFVTASGTNAVWTKGAVYATGNVTGGTKISAGTFPLDASKSSCTPPLFSSCDIVITSPYAGITGTISGTFTAGEELTQATSNAVAYALNGPTTGGTLYLSKVISGTADATHTWTGTTSSATLASPSAAPTAPGTALVVTAAGLSGLPQVYPIAYITTSSAKAALTITYPYQYNLPQHPSLLVGFCSGTVGSATTNYVFPLGGVAVACSSNTTATVGAPVGSPGVLYNLHVKDGTAPGGSLTGVWTVLVNGTATDITCTITGAATTCSDSTHYAKVAAGDLVTIKDVTGTSSAEAAPTVSLEKY